MRAVKNVQVASNKSEDPGSYTRAQNRLLQDLKPMPNGGTPQLSGLVADDQPDGDA